MKIYKEVGTSSLFTFFFVDNFRRYERILFIAPIKVGLEDLWKLHEFFFLIWKEKKLRPSTLINPFEQDNKIFLIEPPISEKEEAS